MMDNDPTALSAAAQSDTGSQQASAREAAPRDRDDHLDLVRYRNDGDDFHVLWTARRALRLLHPTNDLVAVTVEGVPRTEADGDATGGLLVIDTTESYGAEEFANARAVHYSQLKYSTTSSREAWSVSGLAETLSGFADRYRGMGKLFGADAVARKARFRFVTNRPIAASVTDAINLLHAGGDRSAAPKRVRDACDRLLEATSFDADEFGCFSELLDLAGDADARSRQAGGLGSEIRALLPEPELGITAALKEMVRARTTSDARDDASIRKTTVLAALGVSHEEELLPAPSYLTGPERWQRRVRYDAIVAAILAAEVPVLLHAPGGVGKSVLANALPQMMPLGSAAVVFDGFASGGYRSAHSPRHRHEIAVLQIANELAASGLCDPLLPRTGRPPHLLLGDLRRRLEQASRVVRSRSEDALVLVVLDAADNSEQAARVDGERSFVRDLLTVPIPPGVRVVAVARTERRNLLHPPTTTVDLPLPPFDAGESAVHLRSFFLGAADGVCAEFHRLTLGNPRVQANAIAAGTTADQVMHHLGPVPVGVETIIREQLEAALTRAKEDFPSPEQAEAFVTALATLPPLVPSRVLARASGTSEEAIASFAVDFGGGRPILLRDAALQFRDEPTETWFRERFSADGEAARRMFDALWPDATTDGYVAVAVPMLLRQAGRYDALVELALNAPEFVGRDPLETRDVGRSRVRNALAAAVDRGDWSAACRLLIRAAEDTATHDRQIDFLTANTDLVASLAGPDAVRDFVFRQTTGRWPGSGHAFCAAMFAAEPNRRTEALSFNRSAHEWFEEWRRLPEERREEEEPTEEALIALIEADFRLYGADHAASELSRYRHSGARFKLSVGLVRRLAGAGDAAGLEALVAAPKACPETRLACADGLIRIGRRVPPVLAVLLVNSVLPAEPEEDGFRQGDDRLAAAASAVELGVAAGLDAEALDPALATFMPQRPKRAFSHQQMEHTALHLRALVLHGLVHGREVAPEDLLPLVPDDRQDREKVTQEQGYRDQRRRYRCLLPLYALRAECLSGRMAEVDVEGTLEHALEDARSALSDFGRTWERGQFARQAAAVGLDAFAWISSPTTKVVLKIENWVGEIRSSPSYPTMVSMVERIAPVSSLEVTLDLARRAAEAVIAETESSSEGAAELVRLARAFLTVSPDDAAAYFRLATERLGRLGDESRSQLDMLIGLSLHAGGSALATQTDAFRLARASDLIRDHNSHKFPWERVAKAVTALSPTQALALVSRWHDRDCIRLGWLLPTVVGDLISRRLIPGSMLGVFHSLEGGWFSEELVSVALAATPNASERSCLIDQIASDLEISRGSAGDFAVLRKLAVSHGVSGTRLDGQPDIVREEQLDYARVQERSDNGDDEARRNILVGSGDLLTPEGLKAVLEAARADRGGWYDRRILWSVRHRIVSTADRKRHIEALVSCELLSADTALRALQDIAEEWQVSPAVRDTVRIAALALVTDRGLEIISRSWLWRDVMALTGLAERDLVERLFRAFGRGAELLDAEAIHGLAIAATRTLVSPQDGLDVLRFALDRVEPLFTPETGDGPWSARFAVPDNLPEAIASLLYTALGDPRARYRWRAAHAVRRIVHFGVQDILESLIRQLESEVTSTPFCCHRFVFYYLHAKLFCLIALARAARDAPDQLGHCFDLFARLATTGPPHILIRRFAARAALGVAEALPIAPPLTLLHDLRAVATSPFPTVEADPERWRKRHLAQSHSNGFLFGYDFREHWLGPLAEVFGLQTEDVADLVADEISRLGYPKATGHWDDDRREQETHLDQYEDDYGHKEGYPGFDRLGFYQAWHGLMTVAGALLATKPTVRGRWNGDDFEGWLRRHDLARPDEFWLADRSDPPPAIVIRREHEQRNENWRWQVLGTNLDEVLFGDTGDGSELTVALWSDVRSEPGTELLSVRSALVSRSTSGSLLRAMQTAPNLSETHFPLDEDRRFNPVPREFRLRALVVGEHRYYGLDDQDPFAAGLDVPGKMLRPSIVRVLDIRADPVGRTWIMPNGSVFGRVTTWGSFPSERQREVLRKGSRVMIRTELLATFLARFRLHLLTRVEIRRGDHGSGGYNPDDRTYCRFYVLDERGRIGTFGREPRAVGSTSPSEVGGGRSG
ncbi:hypothetical protein MHZ93_19905 [Roseomonas sp. ACRSG]|nr:hypothetical protein [Roseomonas sp. ACRSG]